LGFLGQNNCEFHESFIASILFVWVQLYRNNKWTDSIVMLLSVAGVLTIPLLTGLALGYGAREMISRRRREAARLRRIND
jgi:hypothetical protein